MRVGGGATVPRSVVLHGHFYQPPRENPWTGEVPEEPSAAPFHDWNRRVHDECYRAVAAARVLDGRGRIAGVVNTLEWISWDAGPTLLRWLAREAPGTYAAFLNADVRSLARTGHGNAVACPYHHIILPLATRRDKVTEVRWGLADFRRRFGRESRGMWLPEAAVDSETLEVLAREGVRFTILGPGQVKEVPRGGIPGRVALSGGGEISVFVYDGVLSHDVAFGELLKDAQKWVARMARTARKQPLVSLATDGETFGHHHRWGDMALGATVVALTRRPDLRLESFASFLARHPAVEPVEVVEASSWSCVHGVGRWKEDCGCKLDPSKPTQQAWRAVLRDALDELAEDLHARFQDEGGRLLRDPWATRDAYGEVLDAGVGARHTFVDGHASHALTPREVDRVLELLEMEHDALRMFTSCAWFFDDLARLEPLQVLRYAAHALDALGPDGRALEDRLRSRLASARSNDPEAGDGRRMWDTEVREATPPQAHPSPRPTAGVSIAARSVATADRPVPTTRDFTRVLSRLMRNPTPSGARRVVEAADDLETEGIAIPFDAGTLLWHALARRPGSRPLQEVAKRLGFAPEAETWEGLPPVSPVRFVFGVHLHQPVGNFDEVFRSHADDVYLPFLRRAAERGMLPLALHVSGPLLEWMERAGHPFLDLVGRLAADGGVELLLSGFYEPVLPALPRTDRLEQIGWMREWLASHFGVAARGLWLTERVWEPGLAADLADAGVDYVLVDDRHFLAAGFQRSDLHRPWRTEAGGRSLSVLSIDERLRYLVPFRSPEEIGGYFRRLAAAGHPLAVLADDGEKFGGWPGTAEWVWEKGWMERFFDEMETLTDQGVVRLTTPTQALREVAAAGLAYLPTASYREMEGWSLCPEAANRLETLEARVAGADPESMGLVRGGHWRNFLARYAESNRMHKKARALSELCRQRGDPPDARRAIGRAQCNDAYWHGVFGGLYLRHLREAVWAHLAEAEETLRRGEPTGVERLDLYCEGVEDIWVHGSRFSAVIRPARGGSVTELTWFGERLNLVDVLTRRREAYHRDDGPPHVNHDDSPPESALPVPGEHVDAMPSIHELEESLHFDELPPFDSEDRALLVDRILPQDLNEDAYAGADYEALHTWAHADMEAHVEVEPARVSVTLRSPAPASLEKRIALHGDGTLEATYRWDPADFPPDARMAPELSLATDVALEFDPPPEAVWRYEIRTVSKSESGTETSVQGVAVTPLWPCRLGKAALRLSRAR